MESFTIDSLQEVRYISVRAVLEDLAIMTAVCHWGYQ